MAAEVMEGSMQEQLLNELRAQFAGQAGAFRVPIQDIAGRLNVEPQTVRTSLKGLGRKGLILNPEPGSGQYAWPAEEAVSKSEETIEPLPTSELHSDTPPAVPQNDEHHLPYVTVEQVRAALAPLNESNDIRKTRQDPCGFYEASVVRDNLMGIVSGLSADDALKVIARYVELKDLEKRRIGSFDFVRNPYDTTVAVRFGTRPRVDKLLFVLAQLPADGSPRDTSYLELAALSRGKYKDTDFVDVMNKGAHEGLIRRLKSSPLRLARGERTKVALYPRNDYFDGVEIDLAKELETMSPAEPLAAPVGDVTAYDTLVRKLEGLRVKVASRGERRKQVLDELGRFTHSMQQLGYDQNVLEPRIAPLTQLLEDGEGSDEEAEVFDLLKKSLPHWQKLLAGE